MMRKPVVKSILVVICLFMFTGFSFKQYTPEQKIVIGQIIYTSMQDIFPLTQEDVKYNLKMKLYKYNRNWDPKTINWITNVLYFGQRQYDIDHRIILNICDIESNFDIKAHRKNTNGTQDYGIVQSNDCNQNEYLQAALVLDENKIWHTDSKNRFDPAIGIMSAYIYLNWARNEITKQSDFSHKRWITSYNCGVMGSDARLKKYKYLESKRKNYWSNYCTAVEN